MNQVLHRQTAQLAWQEHSHIMGHHARHVQMEATVLEQRQNVQCAHLEISKSERLFNFCTCTLRLGGVILTCTCIVSNVKWCMSLKVVVYNNEWGGLDTPSCGHWVLPMDTTLLWTLCLSHGHTL